MTCSLKMPLGISFLQATWTMRQSLGSPSSSLQSLFSTAHLQVSWAYLEGDIWQSLSCAPDLPSTALYLTCLWGQEYWSPCWRASTGSSNRMHDLLYLLENSQVIGWLTDIKLNHVKPMKHNRIHACKVIWVVWMCYARVKCQQDSANYAQIRWC